MVLTSDNPTNIIYPDSDGQPMADNTKQFQLKKLQEKGIDPEQL